MDHREVESIREDQRELIYVDGLAASIYESSCDLFSLGMIDQATMTSIRNSCLKPLTVFDAERVLELRRRENVSQEVLSHYLGVEVDILKGWELGDSLPANAAVKLLTLVENHGLSYIA